MTFDALLTCLRSIQPPANVEEWLLADKSDSPVDVQGEYARGVQDVLRALGVLSADAPTSPMAYYFIQSLLALARDSAPVTEAWQGLAGEGCTGTGARLLHLLEDYRRLCTPEPEPLRKVQTVIAVIKARRGADDVYLMQYDAKAEQFQPIGGKQELFDASSEAALTRELCEELVIPSLTPGTDFQIRPIAEHIKFNEVSASVHVLTQYDHSFYHLTDIRFPLVMDSITRWISQAELDAGRTADGKAITALLSNYIPGVLPTLGYSLVSSVS